MGTSSGNENGSAEMKDWEIITDNLSKAGWSVGRVSALDSNGRTIWIVDAHRDESRFICARMKSLFGIGSGTQDE
jgi:hypothetical protein